MPNAIAISPHLDDAAFSCGGTLARLAASGWDVTICTIFTLSIANPTGFALACQLDKGLPPQADYMALRRAEDAEACRHLGAKSIWLSFAEAPHRGYNDAKSLFGPLRPSDDVTPHLASALEKVLATKPDLILGPQAIGSHVDHVQTVRALWRVLPKNIPVLWWIDFPYSTRLHSHPGKPFNDVMNILPELRVDGDSTARSSACAAYTSQVGFQFGNAEGLADALASAGSSETFRVSGNSSLLTLLT